MADKQINELVELSTPSGSDLFVMYDFAEGGAEKAKKVTRDNAMQYEVGTWTPVPADAASGGNTGSGAVTNGTYTKIGKQVTVHCFLTDINKGSMTAGNLFYIQGLPYQSQTGNNFSFGALRLANISFSGLPAAELSGDAQAIRFIETSSGGANGHIIVSDLTGGVGTNVFFTVTYITS